MSVHEDEIKNLAEELEAERDWRVAELNKIRLMLRKIQENEPEEYVTVYLKMTLPMIYAHWEGFCVASFRILLDFINGKNVKGNEVSYNVLTYANKKAYDKLKGKHSFLHKVEFSRLFIDILGKTINITGKLDTKSNLNYDVLKDILAVFEMNEPLFVEYKDDLNKLVNMRNAIAHGENSRMVDLDCMNKNIMLVTELMDIVMLQQIDYAEREVYILNEEEE